MLKSMTGYGRASATGAGKKVTVEIKSVNHRYSEVVVRLPKNLLPLEERIRGRILECVSRGRVDCYLSIEEASPKKIAVKVDKNLATAYYKALKEMLQELAMPPDVKLEHFLTLPGVFAVEEPEEDLEELWPAVEQALGGALTALTEMRRTEGARLQSDIQGRIARLERLNQEIESRAPRVVEEYRERLQQRVQELVPGDAVEPARLTAETVLFAERSNITEEVVRIASHLHQLRLTGAQNGPAGRKLDFLVQELNREINTIAQKSGDLRISQLVVEVKSELEKIREQVQNVE